MMRLTHNNSCISLSALEQQPSGSTAFPPPPRQTLRRPAPLEDQLLVNLQNVSIFSNDDASLASLGITAIHVASGNPWQPKSSSFGTASTNGFTGSDTSSAPMSPISSPGIRKQIGGRNGYQQQTRIMNKNTGEFPVLESESKAWRRFNRAFALFVCSLSPPARPAVLHHCCREIMGLRGEARETQRSVDAKVLRFCVQTMKSSVSASQKNAWRRSRERFPSSSRSPISEFSAHPNHFRANNTGGQYMQHNQRAPAPQCVPSRTIQLRNGEEYQPGMRGKNRTPRAPINRTGVQK